MTPTGEHSRSMHRIRLAIPALAAATALLVPAVALAHIERPAYWPDPAPDTAVSPPAGGEVPQARSLGSALDQAAPGDTRVVCRPSSLTRAIRSIDAAETHGTRLRPTLPSRKRSHARADRLRELNQYFSGLCGYHQIQRAVSAARI